MMIQAVRLTRKKAALAVILAGAVMAALILLLGRGGSPAQQDRPLLTSNAERVAYLQELGWEVVEEPVTTLQFLLPPQLKGDYVAYNDLQKQQGFDLTKYKGKKVEIYSYPVYNYKGHKDCMTLTIIGCEGRLIGGDVSCSELDGFMQGLMSTNKK